MASLKVFVSSTCYDLSILRSHVRNFCTGFGYEPVMSEFSDVLYDPRNHTHTSCIQEVANSDVLIAIIGSRFGGEAIPKALEKINIDTVRELSSNPSLISSPEKLSITQLEIMKAIECKIPIFTFIDQRVLHEHFVYEKNKDKGFVGEMFFPSIDKQSTAPYIFEFINFIKHLIDNNSIQPFVRTEDIENHLRKQWSGLFQRLLNEQKTKFSEERQIASLASQIADLKAAIVTSISDVGLKETAKGAIRYRVVIEFLISFRLIATNLFELMTSELSLDELLKSLGVIQIIEIEADLYSSSYERKRTAFVMNDGSFYLSSYMFNLEMRRQDWGQFSTLTPDKKKAIIEAVDDIGNRRSGLSTVVRKDGSVSDFIENSKQNSEKRASDDLNEPPF